MNMYMKYKYLWTKYENEMDFYFEPNQSLYTLLSWQMYGI